MTTLKEIIDKLEEITAANEIYNTFGEGNPWEVDGEAVQYPLIWVDAETNNHTITTGSVEFVFDIWFVDLVYNDESNELSIKSDTMDSAIDFVRFLKDGYSDLDFYVKDDPVTALSFTEKWNDKVSGTKITLTIVVEGSGDTCKNIFSV